MQIELLESRRLFAVLLDAEFNAGGIPAQFNYQTAVWGVQQPGGEVETYNGTNATISNGNLNLTAKRDVNGNWTSGEIHTSGGWTYGGAAGPGFSRTYGYFEIKAKMPTPIAHDGGLWPGFWLMPTPNGPGNLHDNGEIDIVENVPDGPINDLDSVHMHYNGTTGHDFHTGVDLSAAEHRYGLDWQPDHLTWYFDDAVVMTVTSNIPSDAHYIIANLAIGDANSWPGPSNAQTANPATFSIDWLHVTSTRSERFDVLPALPADFNSDSKVDIADLSILTANYNKTGLTHSQGDANGDGRCDVGDLGLLATEYGSGTNGAVSQASFATDLITVENDQHKHARRHASVRT